MPKRFVVLPLSAVTGNAFDTIEEAAVLAGRKVDRDGAPHVIVEIVGEVRRRQAPNVELHRFDAETAHG
jgi:hypothetical protein